MPARVAAAPSIIFLCDGLACREDVDDDDDDVDNMFVISLVHISSLQSSVILICVHTFGQFHFKHCLYLS